MSWALGKTRHDRPRRAAWSADLAVRLGWYDQAHINDFRTMLGTTPGEYASQCAG